MSMISAQIDELRELAGDGSMEWVAGPIRASVLRDAADTIWQLRDDLQRANAENAKLRDELAKARDPQRIGGQADPSSFVYAIEQLREFRWQHATNDEDAIPYINNVVAAHERENAKLRELVRDYERCTMHADCSRCEYDGKLSTHCPLSPCFPDADELRELGVEVDG